MSKTQTWFNNVPSPVKAPELIDMVIFRENTEDIYAGIEFLSKSDELGKFLDFMKSEFPNQYDKIRFPNSCGIGIKPISQEGTYRLVESAINYAIDNNRKSVTLVHKGNIMKFTEGGFKDWGYKIAEENFSDSVFTWKQYDDIKEKEGVDEANRRQNEAEKMGKIIIGMS